MHYLAEYGIFLLKIITLVVGILIVVAVSVSLLSKGKEDRFKGRLEIKKLNKKYREMTDQLQEEILPKKALKVFLKAQEKAQKVADEHPRRRVFVLTFNGDIKASAVENLREEITAVLSVAKESDEILVRIESPGGVVHTYGLAASQLQRIRDKKIPLVVCVDKVAASGGYLMASVADHIIAAPFAIIGSIGVIAQLPNFNKLLKKNAIDFEQLTAGEYKRTLTLFGENTEEGRHKLQEEIEIIHHQFKDFIAQNRPQVNITEVATGEHWLAARALDLKLVDRLMTSDDYLWNASHHADIFEINYITRKPLSSRLIDKFTEMQYKMVSMFAVR